MDVDKNLNMSKLKIDNSDSVRGRRLTNIESMRLLFPDLPLIDSKILEEVIKPYIREVKDDKV